MLVRDPNADQPPDPSLSRPRGRSHKAKTAPKKQPQRGLGVAQLEKLRLEEQSKQQEAVCMASSQHQNPHHHSRYCHLSQQDQQFPQLHYQHHSFFHQHHQSQTSPHCLPQKIKHMETSHDKSGFIESRFPLPLGKLNGLHNYFSPFAALVNAGPTTCPLPLVIPQQQVAADDEISTSLVSQVQDLSSPGTTYARPSSAESRLSPLLTRVSPASLVEKSWLNHLYDREPNKEKDVSRCDVTIIKIQAGDYGAKDGLNAGCTNLYGEIGSVNTSMGKLYMQNEVAAVTSLEPCPRSQPLGTFDAQFPSRSHPESPPLGIVSGGVQMKELSSFQTMSLSTLSSVDKVPLLQIFSKKRPWACLEEVDRPAEACKGVDLNTSADEMESELTEHNSSIALPLTSRGDWNSLSGDPALEKLSECKCREFLSEKLCLCHQCRSMKLESPPLANGAAFLSLQKQSIDLRDWEVEKPGQFLTLGHTSLLIQKTTSDYLGLGSGSKCPASMRSVGRNVSLWQSQPFSLEQVRSACASLGSRKADNDAFLMEYKPSYLHTPLQGRVGFLDFFACNKVETLQQESSINDKSLDLELRLSI